MKIRADIRKILNPLNRSLIIETMILAKKRGIKCVECKSVKIKYEQFSPDLGTLLFCTKKCYQKFYSKNIYRALELKNYDPRN